MRKNASIILLLFLALILTGCSQKTATDNGATKNTGQAKNANQTKQVVDDYPISSAELVADKLEVYYFHRTARCYSCNTAGKYVSDLVIEKYSQQIKDGQMIFKELNVELPENKEIAKKYQAAGSSLYINRIISGQDNIEQEAKIWRLLGDEQQFKSYLENKINSYLGI